MNERENCAPKYKVGDWVTIVTDLEQRRHSPGINGDMLALQGQTFRVRYAPKFNGGTYALEGTGWSWTEDWFEEPADIKDFEESEFLSVFEV